MLQNNMFGAIAGVSVVVEEVVDELLGSGALAPERLEAAMRRAAWHVADDDPRSLNRFAAESLIGDLRERIPSS